MVTWGLSLISRQHVISHNSVDLPSGAMYMWPQGTGPDMGFSVPVASRILCLPRIHQGNSSDSTETALGEQCVVGP